MQTQIINTENGPAILIPEELLVASKYEVGDASTSMFKTGNL